MSLDNALSLFSYGNITIYIICSAKFAANEALTFTAVRPRYLLLFQCIHFCCLINTLKNLKTVL